jgi:hypothetical protein
MSQDALLHCDPPLPEQGGGRCGPRCAFSSPSVTSKRLWLAAMAIPRAIACCEGGHGARTAENYKYQEK